MVAVNMGRVDWSASADEKGYRDYRIRWLVYADYNDGPGVVANASGLPVPGSPWWFGNDIDLYAYCRFNWTIAPVMTGEPGNWWTVEQPFSTRPLDRDNQNRPENPLGEPPRVSGSFVELLEEARFDRFGDPVRFTVAERPKGIKWKTGTATVDIELSLASLPLASLVPMMYRVNDATLWGMPKRHVQLARMSWRRNYYGTGSVYYTVQYGFDIDFAGFDKEYVRQGQKQLHSALWTSPDIATLSQNPRNFVRALDFQSNPLEFVFLDQYGRRWDGQGDPPKKKFEIQYEANFLTLGIPSVL